MQLVELANAFSSKVEVTNTALTVDAKSIMSVMRLGAGKGTVLRVVADGADAEEAMEAITNLVAGGFGEE
jgi:phosphocarrier protein